MKGKIYSNVEEDVKKKAMVLSQEELRVSIWTKK